jgi:hypothetical protein
MVGWEDVRRVALALPGATETVSRGNLSWRVGDRGFVWERPLRAVDRQALAESAPSGAILGARVEHLGAREALLADDPEVYFTIPHFDGYPAILVALERIAPPALEEVIVEAWLARAPPRLVRGYLEDRRGEGGSAAPGER